MVRSWRTTAAMIARKHQLPFLDTIDITAVLHWTNRRRRDAHNYMPTIKAIVDGLVDYGVISDDRDGIVGATTIVTGPIIRPQTRVPHNLIIELRITPRIPRTIRGLIALLHHHIGPVRRTRPDTWTITTPWGHATVTRTPTDTTIHVNAATPSSHWSTTIHNPTVTDLITLTDTILTWRAPHDLAMG